MYIHCKAAILQVQIDHVFYLPSGVFSVLISQLYNLKFHSIVQGYFPLKKVILAQVFFLNLYYFA